MYHNLHSLQNEHYYGSQIAGDEMVTVASKHEWGWKCVGQNCFETKWSINQLNVGIKMGLSERVLW